MGRILGGSVLGIYESEECDNVNPIERITINIMLRKILIGVLVLITLGFMLVTINRMRMPYNEMDNYFDGVIVYHRQAILVFEFFTVVFFVLTILVVFSKKLMLWINKIDSD